MMLGQIRKLAFRDVSLAFTTVYTLSLIFLHAYFLLDRDSAKRIQDRASLPVLEKIFLVCSNLNCDPLFCFVHAAARLPSALHFLTVG